MKVLYLVPYTKLVPPVNGGQLRCFHLARVLSKSIPVDLVSWQTPEEVEAGFHTSSASATGMMRFFQIPERPLRRQFKFVHRIFDAVRFRILSLDPRGPAQSFLLESHGLLNSLCMQTSYDAVICEHLETLSAARYLRRISPQARFIYDAHNVDSRLMADEIAARKGGKDLGLRALEMARRIETSLHSFVDLVLCCSEEDRNHLLAMNSRSLPIHVVPNGVDIARKTFDGDLESKSKKPLIFCGDLHTEANRNGLLWFLDEIMPIVWKGDPAIFLVVVGNGSEQSCFGKFRKNARISWKGLLPDLNEVYLQSGVAVVPLKIGSGTRLKALEAMSYGNPVVSTTKGVEGLNVSNSKEICITDDPRQFANYIMELRQDQSGFNKIRRRARKLVESEYSWEISGRKLTQIITSSGGE